MVTMDQIVVDCGPDGRRWPPGDEVVLLGSPGRPRRSRPAEWAERLGTISYEVLIGIGPRVPPGGRRGRRRRRPVSEAALAGAGEPRPRAPRRGRRFGGGRLSAAGYAVERRVVRRWRAGPTTLAAAGPRRARGLRSATTSRSSDGGRLHVVERGQGRPLVLVHGVTLQSASGRSSSTSWPTATGCIVVDQRGHGRSVAGTAGYLFDRLAEDLVEVLGALGVPDGAAGRPLDGRHGGPDGRPRPRRPGCPGT